jgi:hypothetical protein
MGDVTKDFVGLADDGARFDPDTRPDQEMVT